MNVLVADDEPAIRGALARALEGLGHRVVVATDGEEASAAIESHFFDRILLNVRMPRRGGDALYEDLKVRRPDVAAKVIFLTGDAGADGTRTLVRDAGRLTLLKPFSLDDLRRVIAQPLHEGPVHG